MPSKATRVLVLLTLLAVVAFWALGRTRTRRARNVWREPVAVAVFVSGEVGAPEVAALEASLGGIGARLTEERDRWLPGRTGPAFAFDVRGPLHPARLPPGEPPADRWLDRALHAWALWRGERAVFAAADRFDPALADVRLHVLATLRRGVAPSSAEGIGAAGGDVGVVRVTFDAGDAFLAATAAVHELFHCLGATDKYDASGHAMLPDGLVEPERRPAWQQRFAEIMVGEVPTGPASGRLPAGPGELAVGAATAAEIGWIGGEASRP